MGSGGRGSGYQAYRHIQTSTSSPAELVLMLYDRLATRLQRAESDLLSGERRERVHADLLNAQEILLELFASLDPDAGELAEQLGDLYRYMHRRLVDANVRKDGAPVREVRGLIDPLRAAWTHAVREVSGASDGWEQVHGA